MEQICLISYFFKPYKGVGAFRLSYWYDRLIDDGYNVTVFTATPDAHEEVSNINRIPEPQRFSKIFRDKSLTWGSKCRNYMSDYLKNNNEAVVIISGGPFLHIISLITLKKHFPKTKWIIDYRDPLANNPRNMSHTCIGKLKLCIKVAYERLINSYADLIITVNESCRRIVLSNNIKVIDNGFDERCFPINIVKQNNYKIVYAGKTYQFRSIDTLLKVVEMLPEQYSFEYVGPDKIDHKSNRIKSYGLCNYSDTSKILQNSTIGVILATGESFESTTKVFDYFAAKLKILIITRGEPLTGTLYEITKNNPNVEWTKDSKEDILLAINKLERPYEEWDYSAYSRHYGYNTLKTIIEKL